MGNKQMKIVSSLFVVLLVLTLALGCGNGGSKKIVTIKVGFITDLTGPASMAVLPYSAALEDAIKWVNENEPIKDAKVTLVSYDTSFDYAKVIPAWDWLKSKGCKIMWTPVNDFGAILKSRAEQERIPVFCGNDAAALTQPPGWVFVNVLPQYDSAKALLGWIVQNWPNYPTKPRFGVSVTDYGTGNDINKAVKDFCQDHPDKAEYVSSVITPMGNTNWGGYLGKLKNCDYVFCYLASGTGNSTFCRDFRNQEYEGTFINTDGFLSYNGIVVDTAGYEAMDGTLGFTAAGWWTDPFPVMQLANELVRKNHPGEADTWIHSGLGYPSGFSTMYFSLKVLAATIDKVGVNNFDGQALYDTAIDFHYTMDGYAEWSFGPNVRNCIHDSAVYQLQAAVEDWVRISDWIPVGS